MLVAGLVLALAAAPAAAARCDPAAAEGCRAVDDACAAGAQVACAVPGCTVAARVCTGGVIGPCICQDAREGAAPALLVTWSLPPRYLESIDARGVLAPPPFYATEVIVDACATASPTPVTHYEFTTPLEGPVSGGCRARLRAVPNVPLPVTVTAVNAAGFGATRRIEVMPRDRLVLALGDSYGSGEGNPDVEQQASPPARAVWQDAACHRSRWAPAAVVAGILEDASPLDTVTFASAACSRRGTDHVLAVQIPQLAARLAPPPGMAPRTVDLVVVSVGGNDLRFGEVVAHCVRESCPDDFVRGLLRAGKASLPWGLERVVRAIREELPGVGPQTTIVLTEYPDPTRSAPATFCKLLHFQSNPDVVIWPAEARWLAEELGLALDRAILSAVARGQAADPQSPAQAPVVLAAGIWDASIGHGYCAADPWVHTNDSATRLQGCSEHFLPWVCGARGALHPNRAGATNVAAAILRAWRGRASAAVFDSAVGAPLCAAPTSRCSTFVDEAETVSLVAGRGRAEANAPNTVDGSADAPDPALPGSIDAIRVTALEGRTFEAGRPVRVEVSGTFAARGPGGAAAPVPLEILAAGNAFAPAWTSVARLDARGAERRTVSAEYVLPPGNLQVVRARLGAPPGPVLDTDDLVFLARTDRPDCPDAFVACPGGCHFQGTGRCETGAQAAGPGADPRAEPPRVNP